MKLNISLEFLNNSFLFLVSLYIGIDLEILLIFLCSNIEDFLHELKGNAENELVKKEGMMSL